MAIRAVNNTITMRPNYEVLRRLSQFQARDEVIETKEFGPVKVDSQRSYNNTTPGNNIAWGEVESVGRGAAWMLDKYRMDRVLKRGDIIGFDLSHQVSTRHEGEELFLLPVDKALCLFNPNMPRPEPLGVHILTVEEAGAGDRFTFASKKSGLTLPRSMSNGELKVSDSAHSKVKMTVERVLDVGEGGMGHSEIRTERSVHEEVREIARDPSGNILGSRVVSTRIVEKEQKPVFIRPDPEAVGMLCLFMHTMSVDLQIDGVRHRFTNWDRVRGLVRDEVEAAE
jgi:hypothetical protein